MESNGKSVRLDGGPVGCDTGAVYWGEPGTNGQHSFYQLIHQGTRLIPCDFIAFGQPLNPLGEHHDLLVANVFAQGEALAFGKTARGGAGRGLAGLARAAPDVRGQPALEHAAARAPDAGGARAGWWRSTSTSCSRRARSGRSNSFDQWGVELGKVLAQRIVPELGGDATALAARQLDQRAHPPLSQAEEPLMQLGMVGLGRMGANMVRRLLRQRPRLRGLRPVAAGPWRNSPPRRPPAPRRSPTSSRSSTRPRARLAHGAGRRRGQDHRRARAAARARTTSSSTAAIPTTSTTSAARRELAARGIHYVDVGTSGGVWGLERGYCMMIGGEPAIGAAPRSALRHARAGRGRDRSHAGPRARPAAPPSRATCTAGRTAPATSSRWSTTASSTGSWPRTPRGSASSPRPTSASARTTVGCRDDAAARSRALPVRPRPCRHRRGVAARQRDRLLAAGPHGSGAARGPGAREVRRPRVGLGRGPLDDQGGHRRGRPGAGADGRALRAVQLARRGGLPEQAAVGDALPVRRARREAGRQVNGMEQARCR